jgi:protein-tyrosine-phosphatase
MAAILFVCLHNAGRSQMSQAVFERASTGRHSASMVAVLAGVTPGLRSKRLMERCTRQGGYGNDAWWANRPLV